MATEQERHPRLFEKTTNIDRRKCSREVPMQVLNMSFPRTGTMSMQTALNKLGYNCYHSSAFFSNIRDCDMWDEALDAKFFGIGKPFTREDWDQLLGSYSGVSADPPPMVFAEDFIAAYPEAKVILVERDIDAWFKSFSTTVCESMWSPWINIVAKLDPHWLGRMSVTHRKWVRGWMLANNKQEMLDCSKQKYREHYELVRRITPKERLLEYKLGDGWEPLCKFLDKEVPDEPFPRVNDSAAVWEQLSIITRRGCYNAMMRGMKLGVACAVIGVSWWLYRRNS